LSGVVADGACGGRARARRIPNANRLGASDAPNSISNRTHHSVHKASETPDFDDGLISWFDNYQVKVVEKNCEGSSKGVLHPCYIETAVLSEELEQLNEFSSDFGRGEGTLFELSN
jgi:hypothetical protein